MSLDILPAANLATDLQNVIFSQGRVVACRVLSRCRYTGNLVWIIGILVEGLAEIGFKFVWTHLYCYHYILNFNPIILYFDRKRLGNTALGMVTFNNNFR